MMQDTKDVVSTRKILRELKKDPTSLEHKQTTNNVFCCTSVIGLTCNKDSLFFPILADFFLSFYEGKAQEFMPKLESILSNQPIEPIKESIIKKSTDPQTFEYVKVSDLNKEIENDDDFSKNFENWLQDLKVSYEEVEFPSGE